MEKTLIRRFTLDKIASAYEEISDRTISGMRRNRLNNLDFAIISNNCWAMSIDGSDFPTILQQ